MSKPTKKELELEVANLRGQVAALEGQLAATRLMQPTAPSFVPPPKWPVVSPSILPSTPSPWWEVQPYWDELPVTCCGGLNGTTIGSSSVFDPHANGESYCTPKSCRSSWP